MRCVVTTVGGSGRGFVFPCHGFTPAIGVARRVYAAVASVARSARRLAGAWRWITKSARVALYRSRFLRFGLCNHIKVHTESVGAHATEPPFLVHSFGPCLFVVLGFSPRSGSVLCGSHGARGF